MNDPKRRTDDSSTDVSDDDAHEAAYQLAASRLIDLANQLADSGAAAQIDDIADGLLAGAIHFWLFARQPCDDPTCESCAPYTHPEARLHALLELTQQLARDSEYFEDVGPQGLFGHA